MKTKSLLTSLFGSLLLLNTSCLSEFNGFSGRGNIVSEIRNVNQFTSVELHSSANVEIVLGDGFEVRVSEYENIMDCIETKVVGSKLIIRKSPGSVNVWNSKANIRITMPDTLFSVKLAGSGNISVGPLFNELQYVTLSGSGNILVSEIVHSISLEAQITGSGDLKVSGNVQYLVARNSGSGNLKLSGLRALRALCTLEGSGNMFVTIEHSLEAYLSGSGDIIYSGNPVVNSYMSGSGRLYQSNN